MLQRKRLCCSVKRLCCSVVMRCSRCSKSGIWEFTQAERFPKIGIMAPVTLGKNWSKLLKRRQLGPHRRGLKCAKVVIRESAQVERSPKIGTLVKSWSKVLKGALAGGERVRPKIAEIRRRGIRSNGTNPKSDLSGRPKSGSKYLAKNIPN